MRNFIYLLLFSICLTSNAQINVVSRIPAPDSTFEPKLTGELFFESQLVIGDQYFNKEWASCDILLTTDELIRDKSAKYNGLYDELIWLNNCNFGKFKIDKSSIKEFWLKNIVGEDIHFKKVNVNAAEKDSLQTIFVEVATEGNISFYIHHKISLQWPQYMVDDNVRRKYDVLKATPVYYIKLPSNRYEIITKLRKKELLHLFPEHQNAISKIIKDNRLNLKLESDFVKAIELLNSGNILISQ
ncbi:MAG: hypothetical protein PHV20_01605 [Bacteroidales bacterium]|nr:hypothetical protein [Bacteroidales bacterium]